MPDLADLTPTFSSNFANFVSSANGSVGWQTTLPHGARTLATNNELEYYSDPSVGYDPFSVANGILTITAQPESNPDALPYDSGIITTERSFSQLYGYFDMRAELPAGAGMWPAFWMLPANLASTREIDVMEMFGDNPMQYQVTDHSPGSGNATTNVITPDLSQGFHDYGVYWTPTSISFYFDGNLVANMPTPADMNVPMFMLANLAVASNVNATTQFPAHMQIQSISAYAYNPNDPGPAPQLYVNDPSQASGTTGQSIPLNGVSIIDTDLFGSGPVAVEVNDKSLGLLAISSVAGVSATGENSWNLQLSGSLFAVNVALATLSYENIPTTTVAPTQDTVTVAAADADGNIDAERIAISLGTGPKLSFINVGPTSTRYESSGNDVFVLDNGQIANPTTDGGQADHLIDFHSASQNPATWDFLALHGFDPTATLVFDHYADLNGAPNESMQYYHVASSAGNSSIFLIQMANGSTAHLVPHDYGSYPT